MIDINEIKGYYPASLRRLPYYQYMLKEYFHYKILDIILNNKWSNKLSLIGGTSLRIIHKIDRFSEDLDFDNFNMTRSDFTNFTDNVILHLQEEGINVVPDDKGKDLKLKSFRRNLVFPSLLYDQKISGHKDQRFLIKIESESHNFKYVPDKPVIQKFNIFTQINAAPADILLSMKIGAVLDRKKGRDFYDCIQLMGKTEPNWEYLDVKYGIKSGTELKQRILNSCKDVDFKMKSRDFERLVFDKSESKKIQLFTDYILQKDFKE